MHKCPKCGAPIYKGMEFCTGCKTAISEFEDESVHIEEKNSVYQPQSQYKGLGGWLVLVGIGLFLTVGFQCFGIYQNVNLFMDGTVDLLSTPGSAAYIPGYAGALGFELAAQIVFLIAAVYLISLYFKKDKRFPGYYIIFLGAFVVSMIIDCVMLSNFSPSSQEIQYLLDGILSDQVTETVRVTVSAMIWCSYMKVSKRVKATFVESYGLSL